MAASRCVHHACMVFIHKWCVSRRACARARAQSPTHAHTRPHAPGIAPQQPCCEVLDGICRLRRDRGGDTLGESIAYSLYQVLGVVAGRHGAERRATAVTWCSSQPLQDQRSARPAQRLALVDWAADLEGKMDGCSTVFTRTRCCFERARLRSTPQAGRASSGERCCRLWSCFAPKNESCYADLRGSISRTPHPPGQLGMRSNLHAAPTLWCMW